MDRVDAPVDRTQWFMPPQVVNAYYMPPFNEVCIVDGMLGALLTAHVLRRLCFPLPFFSPRSLAQRRTTRLILAQWALLLAMR